MPSTLQSGVIIDRYRIVEVLGKGGMGEVYKAWDATLERQIALKILPPEMLRSEDRVRRFIQEAKSASSLNHPHIITIHDIGEASSVRYIAMELVDGETLRQKIHGSPADLRTVIGWLAQAADGLAKAHAAGIVHRDLKPDNIMITRDGYAKVLDFGLAKLVERSDPSLAQNDPTVAPDATREGLIVGTVGYMSPEQIEARQVDARSDVFAFGCILYEAVMRRKPFNGASDVDVMHRIVHERPEPIDDNTIPADLRRIIRRCLAKSPEERIQSMKDVAIELREIVANWDQLSNASDASREKTVIIRAPRRGRWPLFAGIAALIVIVAVAAFFAVRALRKPHFTLENLKIEKLTSSGNVIDFALTPDGRYLVQETDEGGGNFAVWLKQTATGSNVRILPASSNRLSGVAVSPDGNYVYFARRDDPTSRYQSLYRTTALGGDPVRIASDVESAPGFSADGTRMAFLRINQPKREFQIIVANTDGSDEKRIAAQTAPDIKLIRPSWSPDGKSIAFITTAGTQSEISLFDTATGARKALGPAWRAISGVAWLPDGSGVIATGIPLPTGAWRIAFVSYPSGEVTTIRTDTSTYLGVSLTADGKSIATAQAIRSSSLSVGDPNGENLTAITPPDIYVSHVAATTDRPIFVADDGSNVAVWVVDPSGKPRKLEATHNVHAVSASHDGNTIVFLANFGKQSHLYFIRPDGSGLRQLTNGNLERGPGVSPDGRYVVYLGDGKIQRLPIAGGPPSVIADHGLNGADYSPDGKYIAYTQWHEDAEHHVVAREVVVPAEGGAPISEATLFASNRGYNWGPQADSYIYWDDVANANLFVVGDKGRAAPKQLTHFPSGRIFDAGFSPDGKRMYIARGERRNDVVRITDFR